ncbi:MAG TPA: hypothetical protein DCL77_18525 [Prolixibacteraceae bacterium]|jgi:hypothetical protein|nr:hypothetical protein [Prolixibacteraceae bacterium]
MKTTDKIQKTGNQKSNKVMSIVISAVIGLALISSTVSTQLNNSKKSFIHKPEMERTMHVEPWMINASNFTSLVEISTMDFEEVLKYNPEEFVNAELALEKESLINANKEAIEDELALQIEALTNESEYSTSKFVEAEMLVENGTWVNSEDFLEAADAYTAGGSEREVAKYAQKIINESGPALDLDDR